MFLNFDLSPSGGNTRLETPRQYHICGLPHRCGGSNSREGRGNGSDKYSLALAKRWCHLHPRVVEVPAVQAAEAVGGERVRRGYARHLGSPPAVGYPYDAGRSGIADANPDDRDLALANDPRRVPLPDIFWREVEPMQSESRFALKCLVGALTPRSLSRHASLRRSIARFRGPRACRTAHPGVSLTVPCASI